MNNLLDTIYKPDVLSCITDLSSDEIFTPPNIANDMLDLLPKEIWSNPNIKILDVAVKTGVFLREAAKRFIEGEKEIFPDLQERIDHIMHEQLFGIACTELTALLSRRSLYCSKYPNGPYSISHFDNPEGNIRFKRINHTWVNERCKYCGASQDQYDRSDDLETHAYELIHTTNPEEIFNMKFDVIISNPPYQLEDNGNGKSAKPIYHLFVEQAKKLRPKYISMIIPSRWFSGGKGLDTFRSDMLNDGHLLELVDYENYKEVFPSLGGLAGGVCYFLWDRDNSGNCHVVNKSNSYIIEDSRALNEFDTFVRSNKALPIIHKVLNSHKGKFMDAVVSSRKPFNLPTNYVPQETGIPCQFKQKIGLKFANPSDVTDQFNLLNKWKLIAPKAPIAGQTDFTKPVSIYYESNTHIIPPGTCCTESFIVLNSADTEEEILSFKSYLFTKVVRFLLLQCVVSQDITKDRFKFIPDLENYSGTYTDQQLCEKWGITEEEWEYIDSKINNSASIVQEDGDE